MLWLIVYVIGFLVMTPIIGRQAVKDYTEVGKRVGEPSPMTLALTYGLMWPLTLALFAFIYSWESVSDHTSGLRTFFRRVITGTSQKF